MVDTLGLKSLPVSVQQIDTCRNIEEERGLIGAHYLLQLNLESRAFVATNGARGCRFGSKIYMGHLSIMSYLLYNSMVL